MGGGGGRSLVLNYSFNGSKTYDKYGVTWLKGGGAGPVALLMSGIQRIDSSLIMALLTA